jgi:CDP-diglyceride synthetase
MSKRGCKEGCAVYGCMITYLIFTVAFIVFACRLFHGFQPLWFPIGILLMIVLGAIVPLGSIFFSDLGEHTHHNDSWWE